MTTMPGQPAGSDLPPLTGPEADLEGRLRAHVETLAGDIGERNVFRPEALEKAAEYLEATLSERGREVDRQDFECQGVPVRNLELEHRGAGRAKEVVVVGAHYDSVMGSPGANDNGTGVAAVLELARLLNGRELPRTVRFLLFVNEEPPFFQTGDMGSLHYARRCRERNERVVAMLSLETMGYFSDAEGSQQYPFPFRLFYPSRGNFIGFVGNLSSRGLVRRAVKVFRRHATIPSEGAAVPGEITGVGWSDHWAFWQHGYPGIMVTDTAPFRYPAYHTPLDTPERVRYAHLARVVAGLEHVIVELGGG
jgi:acetylornithine deacetylase/succinyl-diaminopimelate desuccinylase-like protein